MIAELMMVAATVQQSHIDTWWDARTYATLATWARHKTLEHVRKPASEQINLPAEVSEQ